MGSETIVFKLHLSYFTCGEQLKIEWNIAIHAGSALVGDFVVYAQTVACQTHSSCGVGAGRFSGTQSKRKLHTFLMNKASCSLETKTAGQVCAFVKALGIFSKIQPMQLQHAADISMHA